jgi:DNA polymerase III sliding clamp (beta) subunit (PCNA family)
MSDMLKGLKFVSGAVAKKDFVPSLKHFLIENNRVRGFNGTLALCSPIPFDIACKPEAVSLIKAIGNCEDTIQLSLTKAGSLHIKSGVFEVNIKCIEEETPHVEPEGAVVEFDGKLLLDGLKAVERFIGNDASRLWGTGVLVKDGSLFATNNVILVQYWLGVAFPHVVNIPHAAVKEMLRIGEPPIFAQVAENSITFHYLEDRWIRTQLLVTEWPDLGKVLNKPSEQAPLDTRLFNALVAVGPFVEKIGCVIFKDNYISTHDEQGEGASYHIPDMLYEGRYHIDMLWLLEDVAQTIDWSQYPAPCIFQGGMLRGAIIGMRK